MAVTAPSTVWLVAHTHWDREWYEPFQRFRLRLVDLMDDVTARAEAEPEFRFTMDGQMAAIDDYLEVRPEREPAVTRLVRSGQLAVGPWRVLMDEFLCSGETMVRNLELGWQTASRLGPVMPVGYLPDMFGHCAQMPQILRLAGLEQACVYRGVPARVGHHEFWWRAPDGTGIRAEFLAGSYGNAADLFLDGDGHDTAAIRTRLHERLAVQQPWFGADDFLAMYGTDHAAPLPGLLDQVRALDAAPGGPRVRLATLTEYLATQRTPIDRLAVLDGELRSHARSNILPGVISVRWHLKDAMARAERLLARYAEPFAALHLETYPQYYLDRAWRGVIDSSCHDSVTGCGVDETALQVHARIAEASHAAQAVRDQALGVLARRAARGSHVLANPLPRDRDDVVVVELPVPEEWPAVGLALPDGTRVVTQELRRPDRQLSRERVPAADLAGLLGRVHDRELFGLDVLGIDIDARARRLTFRVGDHGTEPFDAVRAEAEVADAARAGDPAALWDVVTVDEPRRLVAARVPVPALGSTTATPARGQAHSRPETPPSWVEVGESTLDNGLLGVRVDQDGSLTLTAADGTHLTGVGRLVDGGDCGDTYNYGPPAQDRLVASPTTTRRHVVIGSGPVLGAIETVRRYDLPMGVDGPARSAATEPFSVTTRIELRSGEPFVRLHLAWENRSRDHRLRLHVPLARQSQSTDAEGQWAVVRRGLTAEGGPVGEVPIPTYPAERFVDAGGVGVLLSRTCEYELLQTPSGQQLAITLLRAVGFLSRNVHPYRSEPAGPQIATPEAQVIGRAHMELAVMPHAGEWHDAGLVDWVEHYLHPVVGVAGTGSGSSPAGGAGLRLEGAGVVMTSLRRRDQWLELRVVNESPASTQAAVSAAEPGVLAARHCDGMGRAGEDVALDDGVLRISLRPWEIAAFQLQLASRG